MTADEAIALLDVKPAIEVAWTSKDGTKRDDDGDAIDERQTVPWVLAEGPFGTWPETLEDAVAKLRACTAFVVGPSLRVGRIVRFEPGWGYAARGVE